MSSPLRALRALCPALFLVLSLSAGLFLAWNMPPFMNADELAHVQRADLLTLGRVIGERVGTPQARVAGGMVDIPFEEAAETFTHLQAHEDETADLQDFQAARAFHFDGRIKQTAFPGAAPYPPVFYLPAAAAFGLGKTLHWSILDTLHWGRTANAVCCALIGFLALKTAGRARLPLFAILMLPMSLSLFASLNCDGLLLATTALGVALISRAIYEARPMTAGQALGAALCFALVGATKPPYAVFGLVFLAAPGLTLRLRAAASAISFGMPALWLLWMGAMVRTPARLPGTNVDPQAQAEYLAAHPGAILDIASRTLSEQWDFFAKSFVGILGWLDTPLPDAIYPAAIGVLVLAFLLAMPRRASPAWTRTRLLVPFQLLLAGGGVFLSMYLLWTDVGLDQVHGVQGRYLLPLALFAVLMVEGDAAATDRGRGLDGMLRVALTSAVLAFPLISLAVTQHAIIWRYYLD